MKKQDFVDCVESYFDKEYDLRHKESNTPKISVYYMIGYLGRVLGRKVEKELELYMDSIMEKRNK